jgi:hypothetical protein
MVSSGSSQTSAPIDPRELYLRCLRGEHKLHQIGPYGLKAALLSMIAFGALLPPNLEAAEKYQLLLRHLRRAGDESARLRVIASWLKQEGICQPREFLPKSDFLDMTAPFAGVLHGIVPSKLRYAHIVENWRPYFDALIAKSHELGSADLNGKAKKLERLGFVTSAVKAVVWQPSRSPIAAICRWLPTRTDRRFPKAEVLANAHSKVFGQRR